MVDPRVLARVHRRGCPEGGHRPGQVPVLHNRAQAPERRPLAGRQSLPHLLCVVVRRRCLGSGGGPRQHGLRLRVSRQRGHEPLRLGVGECREDGRETARLHPLGHVRGLRLHPAGAVRRRAPGRGDRELGHRDQRRRGVHGRTEAAQQGHGLPRPRRDVCLCHQVHHRGVAQLPVPGGIAAVRQVVAPHIHRLGRHWCRRGLDLLDPERDHQSLPRKVGSLLREKYGREGADHRPCLRGRCFGRRDHVLVPVVCRQWALPDEGGHQAFAGVVNVGARWHCLWEGVGLLDQRERRSGGRYLLPDDVLGHGRR
mmetsp:Transcript_13043/g.29574  ORF Transcript_13043/g.29574 Transcript_13043/m.29574 type:complete len:312 (+) Transcript_13043:375-1310(+)